MVGVAQNERTQAHGLCLNPKHDTTCMCTAAIAPMDAIREQEQRVCYKIGYKVTTVILACVWFLWPAGGKTEGWW